MVAGALRVLAAGALAAALVPVISGGDQAQAQEPELEEVGCAELSAGLGALEDELTCGRVTVPAFHDDPDKGGFQLAVAVADGATLADPPAEGLPDEHPLMILGGGPGERVLDRIAPAAIEQPARLGLPADGRDLVFVEQRGIRPSTPVLDCDLGAPPVEGAAAPWLPPERPGPPDEPPLPFGAELESQERSQLADAAARCADDYEDELAADDDLDIPDVATYLSAFTTAESARDLAVVAEAIDADAVHLKGVSYGAKLALQAAAATPDTWETLTLASAISTQDNYLSELPASFLDTLERLEEACQGDPGCAERVGGSLAADLDDAVDRLATNPDPIGEPAVGGGLLTDRVLAREALNVFYGPARETAVRIDALGDTRYVDTLLGRTRAQPRGVEPVAATEAANAAEATSAGSAIELGMHLAFTCNEEVAWGAFEWPPADRPVGTALYASSFVDGFYTDEVCEAYEATGVPEDPFADAVAAPVPTLVVTGALDQITPPSFADRVVDALEAQDTPYVAAELPDATHSPTTKVGRCGQELVEEFLVAPPTGPDEEPAGCAQDREVAFDVVLSQALSEDVQRVGGADRVATAADLSGWTFHGETEVAYLASSEAFPDALAAGAIAGAQDAPVLLTSSDGLASATEQELARLAPDRVVVLGGDKALSDDVEEAVAALDAVGEVGRIAGENRYATAQRLAEATFPEGADTVMVATGEQFPDALAGGPLAAAQRAPLLLTRGDALPEEIASTVTELDPERILLLGGDAAVTDDVEGDLAALVGASSVERIAGENRYETAQLLAERVGAPIDEGYVASGESFPDALAGTPLAAGRGPLLLARLDSLPDPTVAAIRNLELDTAVLLGGPAALDDVVGRAVDDEL